MLCCWFVGLHAITVVGQVCIYLWTSLTFGLTQFYICLNFFQVEINMCDGIIDVFNFALQNG